MEDGDSTEVTISHGKEWKFVEGGGGIDINWTDTSTGSDGDPYDLTFTLGNHSGDLITSGTVSADRIANLAASKITSGAFDADRIPSLAAGKITSGTFDAARIPNLATSKITSGTFADARIASSSITQHTDPKYLRSDANDDFTGTLNYTPDTGTILSVDGQAILQRMTANGAITIGHDDAVIIAGGDTSSVMNTNINNATETVFVGAEGGLVVYAFPSNNTSWSNRKELSYNGTALDVEGNITVSGTVDGRDIASDGSKLDGIASGATANSGTVTSVATGTGLSGGTITSSGTISLGNHSGDLITSGTVAAARIANLDASKITSGTIPSARLDSDTAHLSGTQTFTGAKTFNSLTSFTMDGNTISGIDDSGEFTDNDAHIMTSAAVNDRISSVIFNADMNNVTLDQLGVNVSCNGTDGRIDAGNDIVAFSSSDKRLKENIKPLDNALDKVSKISGVEFDWKPLTKEEKTIHGNEGHDVGVIAQEIEEVLPEVVQTRDTGYKAVKYEKIVPLLIEAIKELKEEIEELKK